MSRASCAATLGHLAEYRGIVDTLTKLLDDEAAADVPAVLERLAAVDTRLQQSASALLDERAQRERTAALSERAAERRTELLQLASKLQRTEAQLSTLAAQARGGRPRAGRSASARATETAAAGAAGALGAAHTKHRPLALLTHNQARETLATTDESARCGRKVSAAALIEYAERVSYSTNPNPNPDHNPD